MQTEMKRERVKTETGDECAEFTTEMKRETQRDKNERR